MAAQQRRSFAALSSDRGSGLPGRFKEASMMQRFPCERGKELNAGANGLGLERIAQCKAEAKGGKFHRPLFQVYALDPFEQPPEDRDIGAPPFVSAPPVQNQPLIGLNQKHTDPHAGSRMISFLS